MLQRKLVHAIEPSSAQYRAMVRIMQLAERLLACRSGSCHATANLFETTLLFASIVLSYVRYEIACFWLEERI